jgi:hypothetical protein
MGEHEKELMELTLQLRDKAKMEAYAKFHGDKLINASPSQRTSKLLLTCKGPYCLNSWLIG